MLFLLVDNSPQFLKKKWWFYVDHEDENWLEHILFEQWLYFEPPELLSVVHSYEDFAEPCFVFGKCKLRLPEAEGKLQPLVC